MKHPIGDITTILLDYDNTLVLLDETVFAQHYMQRVSQHYFPEVPADEFFTSMLVATRLMGQNQGPKTNIDVFVESFCPAVGVPKEETLIRFESFYNSEHFISVLEEVAKPADGLEELFQFLEAQGIDVVVATNPLFPATANEKRLSWAGVFPHPVIKLITNADEFHSCKPNLAYYLEVLNKIDARPEECLMVGNDPRNDLPAGKLGIKTYLIKDESSRTTSMFRSGGEKEGFTPDYSGKTLKEFIAWLESGS
ncbi:MAG: HAD family hydrolase [Candidatus Odinarchaeota archaeon]